MGKFSILLCDSDEVYAKRLAAGLQKLFRERVQVKTCSEGLGQNEDADLLLGNWLPEAQWQRDHPDCIYIWLDEGESPKQEFLQHKTDSQEAVSCLENPAVWQMRVGKYQPVSKIASTLQKFLPTQMGPMLGCRQQFLQTWYGVVSPIRHTSMIPFASSLAGILGEEKKVLLLVLMEFSGVSNLLGLPEGLGMESFLMQLRQKESLAEVPFPVVQTLEEFDLLQGPNNPMVLYELKERDIVRLMERIQLCGQYDTVVWVAGNMICGIGELFARSERIFSVERKDPYSHCCQQEFHQFFEKLQQKDRKFLQTVYLPVLTSSQRGKHLLWQWKHSTIGELAKKALKGDVIDGTDDGAASREDFGTSGFKW